MVNEWDPPTWSCKECQELTATRYLTKFSFRAGAAPFPQSMGIPSYFLPGPLWTQMEQAVPVVRLVTINPHSGPAARPDKRYADQVRECQAAGLTVLGYVYTGYAEGSRSIATITMEIDKYYAWYGVDGIVFDEASTDCSRQPYYAVLNAYVKQKGGKAITVMNPGTWTEECYMACADIIITFEDTYSAYIMGYQAPRWARKYAPNRFWHLIHSTPTEADMLNAVRLSKARRAGWVYVTSDEMPNPWDTLPAPTYWTAELQAVAS